MRLHPGRGRFGSPAEEVEAVPGSGVVGVVQGEPVRLGRPGFVPAAGMGPEVSRMQAGGSSLMLVEQRGELLGAIAVRDELRPEPVESVAGLHRLGMTTVMPALSSAQTTF